MRVGRFERAGRCDPVQGRVRAGRCEPALDALLTSQRVCRGDVQTGSPPPGEQPPMAILASHSARAQWCPGLGRGSSDEHRRAVSKKKKKFVTVVVEVRMRAGPYSELERKGEKGREREREEKGRGRGKGERRSEGLAPV